MCSNQRILDFETGPGDLRAHVVEALTSLAKEPDRPGGAVAGSIARPFQRATKAFLDEYLVSETGKVPFGGRDRELECLDSWLSDEKAAPRMPISIGSEPTGPARLGRPRILAQPPSGLEYCTTRC
jgi:hypothetical protein